MLEEVILFILTFLLIFIIYELFLVRKAKKDKRRKRPVEVNYLIGKFNIDLDKINYKRLLNIISAVSSFDISLEELQEISGGLVIGKPHFAKLFLQKGYITNKDIQ